MSETPTRAPERAEGEPKVETESSPSRLPPEPKPNGRPAVESEHRVPLTAAERIALSYVGEQLAPLEQERRRLMEQHDEVILEAVTRLGVPIDLSLVVSSRMEGRELLLRVVGAPEPDKT